MAKKKKVIHPEFGRLIASEKMEDGEVVAVYINGNTLYMTIDDKIEQTVHTDDAAEVFSKLLEMLSRVGP